MRAALIDRFEQAAVAYAMACVANRDPADIERKGRIYRARKKTLLES